MSRLQILLGVWLGCDDWNSDGLIRGYRNKQPDETTLLALLDEPAAKSGARPCSAQPASSCQIRLDHSWHFLLVSSKRASHLRGSASQRDWHASRTGAGAFSGTLSRELPSHSARAPLFCSSPAVHRLGESVRA